MFVRNVYNHEFAGAKSPSSKEWVYLLNNPFILSLQNRNTILKWMTYDHISRDRLMGTTFPTILNEFGPTLFHFWAKDGGIPPPPPLMCAPAFLRTYTRLWSLIPRNLFLLCHLFLWWYNVKVGSSLLQFILVGFLMICWSWSLVCV